MSRGRGQVPPYGKDFRLTREAYHPVYTHSAYQYRANPEYVIRAEKGSKHWWVLYRTAPVNEAPLPSLTRAMEFLLSLDKGGSVLHTASTPSDHARTAVALFGATQPEPNGVSHVALEFPDMFMAASWAHACGIEQHVKLLRQHGPSLWGYLSEPVTVIYQF